MPTVAGNSLAEGATRALGKVLSKFYNNKGLGYKTFTKLYDTCICPVMDYGAGVWGYESNKDLDKIHHRAMRCFLGVNKYGTKAGIEGDMAWVNPNNRRKVEMLRLWNKLVKMNDDRLPKIVYCHLTRINGSWLQNVKQIFTEINCIDVFNNNVPIVNFKEFTDYAIKQLLVVQKSKWLIDIKSKPKLLLYESYKDDYVTEKYCTINLKRYQRSLLAKLRLGMLPINIEIGRYNGIPREERWCVNCKDEVEDEIHVLFHCPLYQPLRQTLIREALELNVGFHILSYAGKINFLTSHENVIRKTANYIEHILKTRQNLMRI